MIGGELQTAQYAALSGAGVADGRVYDKPPALPDRVFPYVTIGDEQVIDDGTSCADAWEILSDVHVWSRPNSGSKLEVKTLTSAIVPLLAAPLAVVGHRVVEASLQSARTFRDPDGITEHSVMTFRYLVDPQ
jgi:hypothetical protein